jgi:shikimate dehydrogenase
MGILDVVNKPMDTQFLIEAKEVGCKVAYGYRMLLWQGVEKFKLYTDGDVEPPIEVMEVAMEAIKNS